MSNAVKTTETTEVATLQDLGLPAFNPLESVERPTMPRIKVSRETAQFLIDENAQKTIEGHILSVTNLRAWWRDKFGDADSGAPQCFALGSTTPDATAEDVQSTSCLQCRRNKFSRTFDATGLACHSKKRFLFLRDGEAIPALLDIPALGIKACDVWLSKMASKPEVGPVLPLWQVSVSLQKRQSKETDRVGVEPVFEVKEKASGTRASEIAAAVRAFGPRTSDTQASELGGDDEVF